MTETRRELRALFFTRFANSFGMVTLLTLLPTYINLLDPKGFVLGMFATGLTLAQAIAVVPVAWAGDRFDKRTILLIGLGLAAGVYAGSRSWTRAGASSSCAASRASRRRRPDS